MYAKLTTTSLTLARWGDNVFRKYLSETYESESSPANVQVAMLYLSKVMRIRQR